MAVENTTEADSTDGSDIDIRKSKNSGKARISSDEEDSDEDSREIARLRKEAKGKGRAAPKRRAPRKLPKKPEPIEAPAPTPLPLPSEVFPLGKDQTKSERTEIKTKTGTSIKDILALKAKLIAKNKEVTAKKGKTFFLGPLRMCVVV